jgi:hypothetical protein
MQGDARRISYRALGKGVPVRAAGGEELGTVEHVLEVPELDVVDWFGRTFGRAHWKRDD